MTRKAKPLHTNVPHRDSADGKKLQKLIAEMVTFLAEQQAKGEVEALCFIAVVDTGDAYMRTTHGAIVHDNLKNNVIAELEIMRAKLVASLLSRGDQQVSEEALADVLKTLHDAISAADDPDKH